MMTWVMQPLLGLHHDDVGVLWCIETALVHARSAFFGWVVSVSHAWFNSGKWSALFAVGAAR
jgi:hypothetical protein